MKNQACCFTGHRNISKSDLPNVLQKTDEYIRKMINCGIVSFFVGGALGFDTLAAELLFKIRDADAPFIKVILAYPFEGYTNRWRDPQKKKHRMLLPLYDQFVCVFIARQRFVFRTEPLFSRPFALLYLLLQPELGRDSIYRPICTTKQSGNL